MDELKDEIKYLEGQIAALKILMAGQMHHNAATTNDPEKTIKSYVGMTSLLQDQHLPPDEPVRPFAAGMVDSLKEVMDTALEMHYEHQKKAAQ